MNLSELLPAATRLTPAYDWQQEIAERESWALSRSPRKQLIYANVVAAVDLFSLATNVPWSAGMTGEEQFGALQQHFMNDLAQYAELLRKEAAEGVRDPVGNFRKRVQGSMRRHYYDAYALGRQQSDPLWGGFTAADIDTVRSIIDGEYGFLRGFTADLRDKLKAGEPLPGNIEWRASLYGESLRKAYQQGIADGAKKEDTITIASGPVKTDHCAECPPRWGTYTKEQYEAMNPPPQNWCEGHGYCKCIVTVHHAVPPEIQQLINWGVVKLGDLEEVELPLPLAFWRQENMPSEEEVEAWMRSE